MERIFSDYTADEIISRVTDYGAFTHDGPFHADDVFCAALLGIACGRAADIIRSRDLSRAGKRFVFDVGGGAFDHHGSAQMSRTDRYGEDIPYAAAGKLWAVLGPSLLSRKGVENIETSLVQPIDLADNRGPAFDNPFTFVVRSFLPAWDESTPEVYDTAFRAAVEFAQTALTHAIRAEKARERAEQALRTAVATAPRKDGFVVLDSFIPFNENIVSGAGASGCISKAPNGDGYVVRTTKAHLFKSRLRGSENLPEGVDFVHQGGFIGRVRDYGALNLRALVQ